MGHRFELVLGNGFSFSSDDSQELAGWYDRMKTRRSKKQNTKKGEPSELGKALLGEVDRGWNVADTTPEPENIVEKENN